MATVTQIHTIAHLMESTRIGLDAAFDSFVEMLPIMKDCTLETLQAAKKIAQCRQAEGVYSLADVVQYFMFDSAIVLNFGGREVSAIHEVYPYDDGKRLYQINWRNGESTYSNGDIRFVVRGIGSWADWLDKVKPMAHEANHQLGAFKPYQDRSDF